MSIVIALGSNLGQSIKTFNSATEDLSKTFTLKAKSSFYKSQDIYDSNAPHFINQILIFESMPNLSAFEVMNILLHLEIKYGRIRTHKGSPRTLDLDLIFYDEQKIEHPYLMLPHPRWHQRSFIIRPLQELKVDHKFGHAIANITDFTIDAFPLTNHIEDQHYEL